MYPFTDYAVTKKYTAGKFQPKYIILHHTGGGSYQSNIKYLTTGAAEASVHFIIGPNEECCKCFENEPKNMRHCGFSEWGNLIGMNKYSLGIEVVGYGKQNLHQLMRLTDLVEYLMGVFNIPKENVLTHACITQRGDFSKKRILRDGKRSSRKVDIAPEFFPMGFEAWREQLTPRTESRYK